MTREDLQRATGPSWQDHVPGLVDPDLPSVIEQRDIALEYCRELVALSRQAMLPNLTQEEIDDLIGDAKRLLALWPEEEK